MSANDRPEIGRVMRHGSSCVVPINKRILKRLGWNLHDALSFAVIEGSLVITRVPLPRIPDIRRENHATSDK